MQVINQRHLVESIPLYQPDLNVGDEQALLTQLSAAPFRDGVQLARWEGAWGGLWGRSAVAFADHQEGVACLKQIFGWSSGDVVGGDLLLDPAWLMALKGAWLHLGVRDVHPVTGQSVGRCGVPEGGGSLRGVLVQHAFGLPAKRPECDLLVLEEISAIVRPIHGSGWGDVQLLNLSGPRILPTGAGCLFLSSDHLLIAQLARLRQRPPSAAACALGLSLLSGLADRLARREALANRYSTLVYPRGLLALPDHPESGRMWELFWLTLRDAEDKKSLEGFLTRGGIGCGSPVWFDPFVNHQAGLPGSRYFLNATLALPFYASLTDTHCKRIINRLHRWIDRHPKLKKMSECHASQSGN